MTGLLSKTILALLTAAALACAPALAREPAESEIALSPEATAHAAANVAVELSAPAVEAAAGPAVQPAPAAESAPVPAVPAPTVDTAAASPAESTPAAAPAPAAPAQVAEALPHAAEAHDTEPPQTERVALPAVVEAPKPAIDLSRYAAGTIVVETSERKLHLVLAHGETITYPVGVGKAGKSWSGTAYIRSKHIAPPWSPPKAVKREKPWLDDYIPGGSPKNPMGAAAMVLSVDQYAIHGTNQPSSIGGFVSFGCIRMHNKDILDLFKRVHIGTKVVVLN